MSQLKRIGIVSMVKLMGLLYLLIGLVLGAVFTLVAVLGVKAAGGGGIMGLLLGPVAIVIFPVIYGLVGAIAGLIGALLYNFAARVTGGLELELR